MYCVFHHISDHLPKQILFWKFLTKTWASARPPLVGPKAQVFPNVFSLPLNKNFKLQTSYVLLVGQGFLLGHGAEKTQISSWVKVWCYQLSKSANEAEALYFEKHRKHKHHRVLFAQKHRGHG